jgi:DNA-directed RNA polymerase specialized sigma24 family protein
MQPLPPEELLQVIESAAHDVPTVAQTHHDLNYAMNLLTAAKPECYELLWQHYVIGLDYAEIAEARDLTYDGTRMKIGRCLDEARSLVA